DEANRRRQKRRPDAAGKLSRIDIATAKFELLEGLDHANDGAEQAEQRRDVADDLEPAEIALQRAEFDRADALDLGGDVLVAQVAAHLGANARRHGARDRRAMLAEH